MEIFTTETTKYYSNGNMKFRSVHAGDLVIVDEWYYNGMKSRECVRDLKKNLNFVGVRKEYDVYGNLSLVIPYSPEGKLHGTQKAWGYGGQVSSEIVYVHGEIVKKIEYNST